jgi:hypothetical protein
MTSVSVNLWTTKALDEYVGGLSSPSKMPSWSFNIPAAECGIGARLREVEGSVCWKCYALKGRYNFPQTLTAMYRRFHRLGQKRWAEVMAELIRRRCSVPYFRWHDSGDLQSVEHLAAIVDVARGTPETAHWLPTREYGIVSEYVEAGGELPPNLNVRLSAHMIGGHVPTFPRLRGLVTVSTVSSDGIPAPHVIRGISAASAERAGHATFPPSTTTSTKRRDQ